MFAGNDCSYCIAKHDLNTEGKIQVPLLNNIDFDSLTIDEKKKVDEFAKSLLEQKAVLRGDLVDKYTKPDTKTKSD